MATKSRFLSVEINLSDVFATKEKETTMATINSQLAELHRKALTIKEDRNGDIDYSESQSMFSLMKNIANSPKDEQVNEYLKPLYELCQHTPLIDNIDETEGVNGFSGDYRTLPKRIVNICPELKHIDSIKRGLLLISSATKRMDKESHRQFVSQISNTMMSFDLMGEEVVTSIFQVTP